LVSIFWLCRSQCVHGARELLGLLGSLPVNKRVTKYLTAASPWIIYFAVDSLMKGIFLLPAFSPWGAVACQTTPIVFQHVRVFDGLQVTPSTDVLIRDGRIQDIGQDLKKIPPHKSSMEPAKRYCRDSSIPMCTCTGRNLFSKR
jgi:hypothetical protein